VLELPEPEDDGLIIPTVGEWARDKHHFLRRYIDAFTTSMRAKQWAGLHYIDLFAGPGIARLRKSKRLDWGSPLIAAQAKHLFDGLHFCELDAERHQALQARLERLSPASTVQVLQGDANERVAEIVVGIPGRSLSLAFLDPSGLHLDYETLRSLAARRADLVIFFPDRLDILRNWKMYYWDNPDSNLDRVLGPGAEWRALRESTPRQKWIKAFLELYQNQIGRLGYTFFEYEGIPSGGRRLYWLIFCSRHKVGADIWRRTSLRKPDDQQTFNFDAT
jgi:three-Cys-motif partner protein